MPFTKNATYKLPQKGTDIINSYDEELQKRKNYPRIVIVISWV